MNEPRDPTVHMIPLSKITVVNPRQRGVKKFKQIVDNIGRIGLKRPITVTPKSGPKSEGEYCLVCGEGRLEAYRMLGQSEIPAIVIHVTREKLLLMSLVENLARRQHSTVELVREISALKQRGYSFAEIAKKTDLSVEYVRGILKLMKSGEERLLRAVEQGQIPLNIAMTIATSVDEEVQRALTEAYETNTLRGKKLLTARRLIEQRRTAGKRLRERVPRTHGDTLSGKSLLKTYQEETARQRLLIQKSRLCETRLLFVVSALRQLFRDQRFVELLRSESLDTLPAYLASQINGSEITK